MAEATVQADVTPTPGIQGPLAFQPGSFVPAPVQGPCIPTLSWETAGNHWLYPIANDNTVRVWGWDVKENYITTMWIGANYSITSGWFSYRVSMIDNCGNWFYVELWEYVNKDKTWGTTTSDSGGTTPPPSSGDAPYTPPTTTTTVYRVPLWEWIEDATPQSGGSSSSLHNDCVQDPIIPGNPEHLTDFAAKHVGAVIVKSGACLRHDISARNVCSDNWWTRKYEVWEYQVTE